ncbi:hypothetical protein ACFL34_05930, partial [Candidatus Sumerlaeota bacterium]
PRLTRDPRQFRREGFLAMTARFGRDTEQTIHPSGLSGIRIPINQDVLELGIWLPRALVLGLLWLYLFPPQFTLRWLGLPSWPDPGTAIEKLVVGSVMGLVFFLVLRHSERKAKAQNVTLWENGMVSVDDVLGPTIILPDGRPHVKITKGKNGRVWIIGEGRNLFKINRKNVPAKA